MILDTINTLWEKNIKPWLSDICPIWIILGIYAIVGLVAYAIFQDWGALFYTYVYFTIAWAFYSFFGDH